MAKRFTDTEKWKDVWFDELSGEAKLMYFFYLDNCDCAGIWKGNFRQFQFFSGFKYTKSDFLKDFSEKIKELPNGSFFMPSFIKFQYGELKPYDKKTNTGNKAHLGVVKCLNYNNIEVSPLVAPSKPLGSPLLGVQEKEQDKDKDKDKDKSKLLIDEILDIWNRNAPNFGFPKVNKLNSTRLKKLQIAIKDFDKPEDWIKIFSSASKKGFTGKDGREFIPNWDYVFRNENWIKFHEEYEVLFTEKPKSEAELTAQVEAQLKEQLGF